MKLEVKLMRDGAKFPNYSKDLDVGADVYLPCDFTLEPGKVNKVPLGIAIALPNGYEGNLRARSGSLLRGIITHNPAIDPGYTGEIHALVSITGKEPIELKAGERICSLVITPYIRAEFTEKIINDRGTNGFNSTGR